MTRKQHGMRSLPSYGIWCGIKSRCSNKNVAAYADYGGRGITVCERWRESFVAFHEDMGDRPPGMTIERIDNDGCYEPGNCVWASRKEQSRNRRGRRYLTARGVTKTMAEWAESSGVPLKTIFERLKLGWSQEMAVTTRVGGYGYGPKPKNATAAMRGVVLNDPQMEPQQ